MRAHHLTVDVEEYYHPTALDRYIPRTSWTALPRRSPGLVRGLLQDLDEASARGTFFVLGWLALKEPDMIRAISAAGHEVASHGWDHRRVTDLGPDDFRQDIRRSKEVLEEICGTRVIGYRAPSFSILPGAEWALDILLEEGFEYDSSMFPVRIHPGYGYPDAPPDPHTIQMSGGKIWEIPPATLRIWKLRLPAAGGAYLRFFPARFVEKALISAERRGQPGTVYLHPWELDSNLPPFQAPFLTQIRMRTGTRRMGRRLAHLTSRFRFQPIADTVTSLAGGS